MLLKQKNSRHFTKSAPKAGSLRNPFLSPVFSRAAGDSLTCTYIPLAVLKLWNKYPTKITHQPYMYIHTACGIETSSLRVSVMYFPLTCTYIPLAVLKHLLHRHTLCQSRTYMYIHTACGIETAGYFFGKDMGGLTCTYIPLAVLKQKEKSPSD